MPGIVLILPLGTAREDVHWAVPVLSALPFGMGYLLLFMSLIKYLAFLFHSSEPLADSAAAILLMHTKCLQQVPWQHLLVRGACSRSLFGTVLPFAARPM